MNRIVWILVMQSVFVIGMSGCAKDESSRNDMIMGTPDGVSTIANASDSKQSSGAAVMTVANTREATHDGKVVRITDNKLMMMDKDGQERSHRVSNNTKVTFDGNGCNLVDLKAGMSVRVTVTSDDPKNATEVEAIEKRHLFANTHDGRVADVTGNTLTMTNNNGQEHSYVLGADTIVTCDGKPGKASDLKTGTTIRVTTKRKDAKAAIQIEAIEKNADFAHI